MNILHFGIHKKENKNSGDTLLFKATRDLFDLLFEEKINWTLINLWEPVDDNMLKQVNEHADLVLIGGGGLFLKDQKGAEKSTSGWQWNCSSNSLQHIETPIVVFGVGYNRFRGQEEFEPEFKESINILFQKSILVGLRNTGSMNAIRRYLTQDQEALVLQSCPTTILTKIYEIPSSNTIKKKISFNLAYDRPHFRFGDNEARILEATGLFLRDIQHKGFSIDITLHKHLDAKIIDYLPSDLKYTRVNLTELDAKRIVEYYNSVEMAIGMRGHAQLIPFGLNKKILSIISHDKMQFFLDDIKKEWGVDVNDPNYSQALNERFDKIYEDTNVHNELAIEQDKIWTNTKKNISFIKDRLLISKN